ncbi:family 71 glycosyltransferase [Rhodotorula diobovata]|uniref:Family 71 glycosyltransferase n=1 Tax=Rhodotorula diobovata TaxID=5288 RepID=A0A5C5G3G5_9BASI|nr:family 71 glycosyltransferase [Rhodotorula diobovata]
MAWRNPEAAAADPARAEPQRVDPSSCGAASSPPEDLEDRFERARRPLPEHATLGERLAAWELDAPGWGVEAADWVRKSDQFCPLYRVRPNQNWNQLSESRIVWHSLNTSRVMSLRGEMIEYLRGREREGALSKEAWGEGKGLVFTAGNADTFSRVLLTLKMLRNHLHTSLPSEIFSFPGEEPTAEIRAELEAHGATLGIVGDATRDPSRKKNFHIKATAIIRSRFREVLFLDSDNIPTASLMPIDSPVPHKSYKRHGALFWPDYWRTQADNAIWSIIGVPCRDEWEQEAGQILVDKSRNLDALLLAEWMMNTSRYKFWFNLSDGDKDMFRFAWLALRKRWGVPGRYVSVAALPRNTLSGFCGHTMLQHDHLGKPLFVHANLLKQIPSGPDSLSLDDMGTSTYTSSRAREAIEPLVDEGVDCDMLADVRDDGTSLGGTASPRVRRRAVMEKGIRAGFHGGWNTALCIDTRWDDPRSDEDRDAPPASDGFEVRFDSNAALEVVQWTDDARLRGFEEAFFAEGGKTNAQGF